MGGSILAALVHVYIPFITKSLDLLICQLRWIGLAVLPTVDCRKAHVLCVGQFLLRKPQLPANLFDQLGKVVFLLSAHFSLFVA